MTVVVAGRGDDAFLDAENAIGELGHVEGEVEIVGDGDEVLRDDDLGIGVEEEGVLYALVDVADESGAGLGVGFEFGGLVENSGRG